MPRLPAARLPDTLLISSGLLSAPGSMGEDGKIQSLNNGIRAALPHMWDAEAEFPKAEVMVRAVRFPSGASWHMASAVPVEQFRRDDPEAKGVTDMGNALRWVAEQLDPGIMPQRALPPFLVLISEGQPTDDVSGPARSDGSTLWRRGFAQIFTQAVDE